MARFIELKKPWSGVFCVNADHVSSVSSDRYGDGKTVRETVVITLLSGDTHTADIPYEEFMRLLVPVSLSGDK